MPRVEFELEVQDSAATGKTEVLKPGLSVVMRRDDSVRQPERDNRH